MLLQNSVLMPEGLRCLFPAIVYERSVNLFKLGRRSPALGSQVIFWQPMPCISYSVNILCGEDICHGLTNTTQHLFFACFHYDVFLVVLLFFLVDSADRSNVIPGGYSPFL